MLPLGQHEAKCCARSTRQDLERIELLGAYLLSCVGLAYAYEDSLILFVLHLVLVSYNIATSLEPEESLIRNLWPFGWFWAKHSPMSANNKD